jgi:TatD DNase family protein
MPRGGGIQGFDFHCHIDLHADPVSVMEECKQQRVVVVAVTTTPKAWPQNREWARGNDYIYSASGLHPELVGERYAEVGLLERQIRECQFVGEVGLDGSAQHRKSFEKQREVFRRVLDKAQEMGGRVLTIHSRRAARDVIEEIESRTDSQRVLCILHWFSGSVTDARRAVSAGCYFSVNRTMLANERGRSLVESLPSERLLTETDSPFTAVGSRKSMPWDVLTTTVQLADVRGTGSDEMAATMIENGERVLGFVGSELPVR